MVTEQIIEQTISQLEDGMIDYEKTLREFAGRQPAVMSLLISDSEGALTDDEQELLLYLAVVIWKSVETAGVENELVDADTVAEAEEENWDLFSQAKGPSFRERLDVFFEKTDEEDLLAFIEDSLTPGDEDEDEIKVTAEGREPMFVALKTVVDLLT